MKFNFKLTAEDRAVIASSFILVIVDIITNRVYAMYIWFMLLGILYHLIVCPIILKIINKNDKKQKLNKSKTKNESIINNKLLNSL